MVELLLPDELWEEILVHFELLTAEERGTETLHTSDWLPFLRCSSTRVVRILTVS